MVPEHKFCEQCGKPLALGVKFCEECGSPVSDPGEVVPISPATAGVAGPAIHGTAPFAVIPFVYQQRGILSIDWCTLIVFPGHVIIAYLTKSREEEMDQVMMHMEESLTEKHLDGKQFWELAAGAGFALFKISWEAPHFYSDDAVKEQRMLKTIHIPNRPWERYLSMSREAVLAEDPRNKVIPRETIGYIRGESDPSTSTDQILVGSSTGLITLFFDLGTFYQARNALFSFLLPTMDTTEPFLGVIPYGTEPQVKGFGYQYSWNLVVTERRVFFCTIEDDFADEMNEWYVVRKRQAKSTGQIWRDGDAAGMPDVPWQRLMTTPVDRLLENEVNFFLLLEGINSVQISPGRHGRGEDITFALQGSKITLGFPEGTAEYARKLLEKALPGRIL